MSQHLMNIQSSNKNHQNVYVISKQLVALLYLHTTINFKHKRRPRTKEIDEVYPPYVMTKFNDTKYAYYEHKCVLHNALTLFTKTILILNPFSCKMLLRRIGSRKQ